MQIIGVVRIGLMQSIKQWNKTVEEGRLLCTDQELLHFAPPAHL